MDFYNLLNNTFDKIELNNYFCSDINNNIEFNLKGLFTNDIYKYLESNIELSDHGMNNINEFQNLIEDNPLEVIIYFSESTIDYTKRKKPLSLYLNYITKLIDFNFYKQSNILFSKIEFTNDDALMFSNEKTINGICLDKVNDNFEFFNIRVNQRLLGKFIIQASSKILIYRQYDQEQKKLVKLNQELQMLRTREKQALNSGYIEYGSEAWSEMESAIADVCAAIAEAENNLIS